MTTPIIPRSGWTSSVPRVGPAGDLINDIEYFTPNTVKGVVVHNHGGTYPLLNRSPNAHLENVRRNDTTGPSNLSDIKYNLAVSPRIRGVWELRGLKNKSSSTDDSHVNDTYISIYCQLAHDEKPTDILLENLRAARSLVLAFYPRATEVVSHGKVSQKPTSCPGAYLNAVTENKNFWDEGGVGKFSSENSLPDQSMHEGDESIYVYHLISQLSNWGYYRGKNHGKYDSLVSQGVRELQVDLKEGGFYPRNVDGYFGRYTRRGWHAVLTQLENT